MSQKAHHHMQSDLLYILDPEVQMDMNPAEHMESKLARSSSRVGGGFKDLKPNSAEKK